MGLFDRLMGRNKQAVAAPVAVDRASCPHVTLVGRWDSVQDMGKEDRANSWVCSSCNSTFTNEEARALRGAEQERLRAMLGGEPTAGPNSHN